MTLIRSKKIRYIAAMIAAAIFLPLCAAAQQNTPDAPAHKTELSLSATTLPELQAKVLHTITIPHNVEFRAGATLSPVSVNALADTIWTPLPFAPLIAISSVGSGWNTAMADGLRINEREGEHDKRLSGNNFAGAVYSAGAGAALQFDYAALFPGKWNHIVARSFHSLYYRGLTSASSGESWLYEADDGENRNGLNYYGNLFVGYKMPFMINLAGILIEGDRYLYNDPDGHKWGDDLIRWTLSSMIGAQFTGDLTGTLLVQFRSRRNFTSQTEDYDFYQDRVIDNENEQRLEFYRAAFALTYTIQ